MIPEVFIENWRKTIECKINEHMDHDSMIARASIDLYIDSVIIGLL